MTHDTLVDIFFIITGVATVIVTILLAIGILYLITIFQAIKRIVRTAEFASKVISEDVMELRDNIKERGLSFGAFASFLTGLAKGQIFGKKKKSSKKE